MIRTTVFILAILFSASHAAATGGVYCDGADEDSVGAYLSVGRVPGFAVVNAHIRKTAAYSPSQNSAKVREEYST